MPPALARAAVAGCMCSTRYIGGGYAYVRILRGARLGEFLFSLLSQAPRSTRAARRPRAHAPARAAPSRSRGVRNVTPRGAQRHTDDVAGPRCYGSSDPGSFEAARA